MSRTSATRLALCVPALGVSGRLLSLVVSVTETIGSLAQKEV
jgi:hypothetical protein